MSNRESNWGGKYTEGEGGTFVGEDEMLKYVVNEVTLLKVDVRSGTGAAQYGSKPTWIIDFVRPEAIADVRSKSLGKGNAERDARIVKLADEPKGFAFKFVKVGRRYDIDAAS